jgi:hypothetical protein
MAAKNSPSRRVLGSKSTNTFLQMQSRDVTSKFDEGLNTTKPSSIAVTSSPPTYGVSRSLPRTGQKRRREEIEQEHADTPSTQTISDTASEENDDGEEDTVETSAIQSNVASASTPGTLPSSSFHSSQEPPHPIEDTFEIHEETMSQQTLEKIVGIHQQPPFALEDVMMPSRWISHC